MIKLKKSKGKNQEINVHGAGLRKENPEKAMIVKRKEAEVQKGEVAVEIDIGEATENIDIYVSFHFIADLHKYTILITIYII